MAASPGPDQRLQMVKHFYLFEKVLNIDPAKTWLFCKKLQKEWREKFSKDKTLADKMLHFRKVSALTLVWVTDKLIGNLPDDISQKETYCLLSELYDLPDCDESDDSSVPDSTQSNAQEARTTQYQLKQHFLALKHLMKAADENKDLSEDLIQKVHRNLMKGLSTEEGKSIKAGEYRSGPVSAGNHSFPNHTCIPESMKKLVTDYNSKLSTEHDMFELASWLLYQIVTLHPFEDGNGRISRLLWCYSLIREGLPFPLTLSDGHEKAHDHYVACIIEDRRKFRSGLPCLTALTVVSIKLKWENFITNLSYEHPNGYEEIIKWVEDNNLMDI